MVTALPRPFLALWNTFVLNERARMATPGMAVLLDRLKVEHPEAPVIYLSTGPWNAAPTLARFLARNMYPSGALLLTDWGLTQDRWFRSGQEHKRRNLELLAQEFPNMRWLLFGDNGQHDEEIYSGFAQQHGDQVAAIGIRQLSASEAVLRRRPLRKRGPHRLRRPVDLFARRRRAWPRACRAWTCSRPAPDRGVAAGFTCPPAAASSDVGVRRRLRRRCRSVAAAAPRFRAAMSSWSQ